MGSKPQSTLLRVVTWIDALSSFDRALAAVGLALASILLLVSGRLLVLDGGWAAWTVRVGLLEPAGIFAILGAYVVALPNAPLSVYLGDALARRRYAAAALVILGLAIVLEATRWFAASAVLNAKG